MKLKRRLTRLRASFRRILRNTIPRLPSIMKTRKKSPTANASITKARLNLTKKSSNTSRESAITRTALRKFPKRSGSTRTGLRNTKTASASLTRKSRKRKKSLPTRRKRLRTRARRSGIFSRATTIPATRNTEATPSEFLELRWYFPYFSCWWRRLCALLQCREWSRNSARR